MVDSHAKIELVNSLLELLGFTGKTSFQNLHCCACSLLFFRRRLPDNWLVVSTSFNFRSQETVPGIPRSAQVLTSKYEKWSAPARPPWKTGPRSSQISFCTWAAMKCPAAAGTTARIWHGWALAAAEKLDVWGFVDEVCEMIMIRPQDTTSKLSFGSSVYQTSQRVLFKKTQLKEDNGLRQHQWSRRLNLHQRYVAGGTAALLFGWLWCIWMYMVHMMHVNSAGSQVFNYFVNRMAAISTKLGRKTIFWDEPWTRNETGTSSLIKPQVWTMKNIGLRVWGGVLVCEAASGQIEVLGSWYSLLLLVSLSSTMFDLILIASVVWKVWCAYIMGL